jgi:hypothetical protein
MYSVFSTACILYIGVIHTLVDLTQCAIHVLHQHNIRCQLYNAQLLQFLVLRCYLGEYMFLDKVSIVTFGQNSIVTLSMCLLIASFVY